MVAMTKAVVRQDARALARLVDEAVERLPGDRLPAVAAILQGARKTIAALEPVAAAADPVGGEEEAAHYFPAATGAQRRVTPRMLHEAQARWDTAVGQGQRHGDEALAAIGPLLAPGEVAARLGVSTSTVNNWRNRGKLLAVRRNDHQYQYPAFQFAASPVAGEQGLVPHFAAVLPLLHGVSPWTQAAFFLTPLAALRDETPLAILQAGDREAVTQVYRLAQQAGEMGG